MHIDVVGINRGFRQRSAWRWHTRIGSGRSHRGRNPKNSRCSDWNNNHRFRKSSRRRFRRSWSAQKTTGDAPSRAAERWRLPELAAAHGGAWELRWRRSLRRWSRLAETNKTVWSSVKTAAPTTATEATVTTAMSGSGTVAVVN